MPLNRHAFVAQGLFPVEGNTLSSGGLAGGSEVGTVGGLTTSSDAASFFKSGRGGVFKPPLARESFFSGGASPAGSLGQFLGRESVASAARVVERF